MGMHEHRSQNPPRTTLRGNFLAHTPGLRLVCSGTERIRGQRRYTQSSSRGTDHRSEKDQ